MIAGTKIAATIDGDAETSNNYKVNFKLGLTGTNETKSEIKWYLLKSGSGQDVESVTTPDCTLKTDATSGTTKYWYATSQASEEEGTCSAKTYINSKLSDVKLVAWGKMTADHSGALTEETGAATELAEALTNNTPSGLNNEVLYTKAGAEKYSEEYYYLVVEYPNNTNSDQNTDMNKNISISINAINDVTSTLVTE